MDVLKTSFELSKDDYVPVITGGLLDVFRTRPGRPMDFNISLFNDLKTSYIYKTSTGRHLVDVLVFYE